MREPLNKTPSKSNLSDSVINKLLAVSRITNNLQACTVRFVLTHLTMVRTGK